MCDQLLKWDPCGSLFYSLYCYVFEFFRNKEEEMKEKRKGVKEVEKGNTQERYTCSK